MREKRCATLLAALAAALLMSCVAPARAADDDEAAIGNALLAWASDFNARRADKICDLFERDVIADIRTAPEQNYDAICGRLKRVLTDQSRTYAYAPPEIKEIVMLGDVALVRLTWRLTISGSGVGQVKSVEQGMDVFRQQPDGSWKIARYMAYGQ